MGQKNHPSLSLPLVTHPLKVKDSRIAKPPQLRSQYRIPEYLGIHPFLPPWSHSTRFFREDARSGEDTQSRESTRSRKDARSREDTQSREITRSRKDTHPRELTQPTGGPSLIHFDTSPKNAAKADSNPKASNESSLDPEFLSSLVRDL